MSDGQVKVGVLLALALLGVAILLNVWEPAKEPTDKTETAAIWDVDAAKVTKVEVTRRDSGRLVLVKDGEDWKVTEPFEGLADAFKAKDLVNDLADVKVGVPLVKIDGTTVGLGDPPAAKVVMTLDDGTTRELVVGDAAPVGNRTYVRAADGSVAAAPGDLTTNALAAADAFKDRTMVRFELSHVRTVKLEEPQGTLDLTQDAGTWWLAGFTRADPHKLEDLLLAVRDLRFDEFADPNEPIVAAAQHTLTIGMDDGSTKMLKFVPETPDTTLVIVDGGESGTVPTEGLAFLDQGPTDIGDQRAFPIDAGSVDHLEVTLGSAHYALDKPADAWTRDGNPEPAAEKALDALDNAGIDYVPGPVPALGTLYGSVSFKDDGGERAIDVGQVTDDGKYRVAKDRAGGGTYLVPVQDVDTVAHALDAPVVAP
jgi:hypothetical protein